MVLNCVDNYLFSIQTNYLTYFLTQIKFCNIRIYADYFFYVLFQMIESLLHIFPQFSRTKGDLGAEMIP